MGNALLHSEFLYDRASFPSCHAGTIAQTPRGLVAAFFGGTEEQAPDVCIYVCRHVNGAWTAPELAADGAGVPCWNPVLFQPRVGPLLLFYKVGPNPSTWWGMLRTSDDAGTSWSEVIRLPDGIIGPIKNKPVQLANGDIVSPTSIESKTLGWRIYFERSADNGRTWQAGALVDQDAGIKAIQPSILVHSATTLQAIGRTRNKRMFETWSHDAGKSWSSITLMDLPNPNSGTDAVTLQDGRHVLVYNDSDVEKVRVPLSVAASGNGVAWTKVMDIESQITFDSGEKMPGSEAPRPDQFSYPAVIQSADGRLHIVYTWKRKKMKYAVMDVDAL